MLVRCLYNRNWRYWGKLTAIAVALLLVVNSLTILDEYQLVSPPSNTHNKHRVRSPRSEKWILMDNQDIDLSQVTLLDKHTEWAGLIMESDRSRRWLRCKSCNSDLRQDGVIEAIKNNAKFIYYADDVATLDHELQQLKLTELAYGLEFNSNSTLFDLAAHFKSPTNASHLKQSLASHYRLGGWRTSFIQTFLPPHLLLGDGETSDVLDRRAPAIVLPKNLYQPFTQKASLYFYDAFWALAPIPETQHVTWSLMTQRLLQELSMEVLINAPPRMKEEGRRGFAVHKQQVEELKVRLSQWVCAPGTGFLKCVRMLTDDLVGSGHLQKPTAVLIHQFLNDLAHIGYKEPTRLLGSLPKPFIPPVNKLLFWPSYKKEHTELALNKSFSDMCTEGIGRCSEVAGLERKPVPVYDNLLLVVVFNRPGHYGVVEYLERMYRPFFPQILYCGHDMANFLSVYNLLKRKISFLEVDFNLGQYGYECVQKAMQMNYDVDGFIHLSDDVLLNAWNVADLPTDRMWFQKEMRVAHFIWDVVPDIWKHPHWGPWVSPYGKHAAKAALAVLQSLALVEQKAKDLMFMLSTNVGGTDRVYYQASDIFYIPKKFSEKFIYAASVFDTHHVHLEIAVPTIMNSLDLNENIVYMNGSYLWYQDRSLYPLKYNYNHLYLHSMKLAPCISESPCQKFICTRYLPCLFPPK